MIAKVSIEGFYTCAYTPYDVEFVEIVRTFARWDKEKKSWCCSNYYYNALVYHVKKFFKDVDIPSERADWDESILKIGEINPIGSRIYLKMPYIEDIIPTVKKTGFTWDVDKKMWFYEIKTDKDLDYILDFARKYKFEIKEDTKKYLVDYSNKLKDILYSSRLTRTETEIPLPPGLSLYPFQHAGVQFIEMTKGRTLIADEMGLGKTVQSLAYMLKHPELRPTIIVAPTFLLENWIKEIRKWLGPNPTIMKVSTKKHTDFKADIVLIGYSLVTHHEENLKNINARLLIVDECHMIKQLSAQRTKAVLRIGEKIEKIIALSGTPLLNRPLEIYPIIKLLKPSLFRSKKVFMDRYCPGLYHQGVSNLDELHDILRSNMMIRRLKKDVLKELPEKRRITELLIPEKEDMIRYNKMKDEFIDLIEKGADQDVRLVMETKLRQLLGEIKVPVATEYIRNLLEASGDKIVVFCYHRAVVNELLIKFQQIAVGFSGEDIAEYRAEQERRFIEDPAVRMLVTTFGAGGVGLNLQVANKVIILELPWRPGDLLQAEDRIHRIGQTKNTETIILVSARTVDERVAELINEKIKIIEGVIEGPIEERKGYDYLIRIEEVLKREKEEVDEVDISEEKEQE
ncbi:DEAD/DEAH box helicase [Caldisericum sp.]|uniref:DEAD/DEAH box helicase n=1 Tax=Caldisericum sp. TaxID=2499687 RepID=UPI003D1169FA